MASRRPSLQPVCRAAIRGGVTSPTFHVLIKAVQPGSYKHAAEAQYHIRRLLQLRLLTARRRPRRTPLSSTPSTLRGPWRDRLMRRESLLSGECQDPNARQTGKIANWQNRATLPLAHLVGHRPEVRAGESLPRELFAETRQAYSDWSQLWHQLAIHALRHVWGIGCTCSTASIEGAQLHSCLKAESMPIMRCADMRGVLRRRAYQRAVSVPTPALEQLWASYERFEQSGSNKSLGRQVSLLVDLLISLVKDVQGWGGACTHLDIVCSSEHGFHIYRYAKQSRLGCKLLQDRPFAPPTTTLLVPESDA